MPRLLSRSVLALELDTAASKRPLIFANSAMKKFTVEPVPTPMTASSGTYSRAARAAACFIASKSAKLCSHRKRKQDNGKRLYRQTFRGLRRADTGCYPWASCNLSAIDAHRLPGTHSQ